MKKMVLLAAIMLMGTVQCVNAQNEYSLEGIGKTLSELKFYSTTGLCLGDFHDGLAWVRVRSGMDERYGFIDKKGNMVVPCIYERVKNFSEGYARVYKDGKYGFVDVQGIMVLPFNYEFAGDFSEGLAAIRGSGESQYAYMNKKGEIVIPEFQAYSASPFQGGIAPIEISKRNTQFIDKKGNVVFKCQPEYRCYGYKDGYYIMDNHVIDLKGNIIVPPKYVKTSEPSEGYCGVLFRGENMNLLWGFYNIDKNIEAIHPQYDDVRIFSEGLAAVKQNKKWGYINKQGDLIIPYRFNEAYNFQKGFAFVKSDEGYAIIDKQGKMVKRLNFEYFGGDFSEGLAVIERNGKWGYTDINGNSSLDINANDKRTNMPTQNIQSSNVNPPREQMKPSPATYVGGEAAMRRFIASTMRYPARAEENGIQGTVSVVFTVEADGSLSNIRLKRPVARYLNEEALRIVSKMPKWQPAQSGGAKVRSEQTVDIIFRLR